MYIETQVTKIYTIYDLKEFEFDVICEGLKALIECASFDTDRKKVADLLCRLRIQSGADVLA